MPAMMSAVRTRGEMGMGVGAENDGGDALLIQIPAILTTRCR
jgi:hypothetical protein